MRVTCYFTNSGVTYSGTKPINGYTIGACKDYLGCVAYIYAMNEDGSMGDFIKMGEILDTGSHERITSGKSLDIFFEKESDCYDWVRTWGDNLYVVLVKGKG